MNKSQGEKIPLGFFVVITKNYLPWGKRQILVLLSITKTSENTIIVGEKHAIQNIWGLITVGSQWTLYTDHVLNIIPINGNRRFPIEKKLSGSLSLSK